MVLDASLLNTQQYKLCIKGKGLVDSFPLVSEWQQITPSLQDSSQYFGRFQQCCSLDGLYSASYFEVLQTLYQILRTVSSAPITSGMTVTFMFHSVFSSLAKSCFFSHFSLSFSFTLWSAGTVKSPIRLDLLTIPFSILLFVDYHKVWSSDWD